MTSADLKFIPQSKAFAVDGEKNPSIPDTSTTAMNLATGFPSVYSKPLADGGKLIQRKEMNTLFYQLMLFQNFLQNGGYITWNNDVMMGIGGYPNGAVLSLIDSTTGAETRVQSCVDNNYLQPTSESIGEKYKVNTSTVPHTYTKDASGDVIWRYVGSILDRYSYSNRSLIAEFDFENNKTYYATKYANNKGLIKNDTHQIRFLDFTAPSNGWYEICACLDTNNTAASLYRDLLIGIYNGDDLYSIDNIGMFTAYNNTVARTLHLCGGEKYCLYMCCPNIDNWYFTCDNDSGNGQGAGSHKAYMRVFKL